MEARLERMERAVADIGMQLEDEIPSSATLEAAVEDLRGEALGALNSMADTLRQEFQRQLDQVFAELASFQLQTNFWEETQPSGPSQIGRTYPFERYMIRRQSTTLAYDTRKAYECDQISRKIDEQQ
ncbi:hypothetical protein F0562_002733 [Nyssa sinensis]|uniref:Uncharacterized protein n=1 Tax=Nyssa sinensis TaxID=561372 RepID=A0A5J5BUR1_9ASTE|nr:hypothetical protein F0562_002733 [Nyssa sinensis]